MGLFAEGLQSTSTLEKFLPNLASYIHQQISKHWLVHQENAPQISQLLTNFINRYSSWTNKDLPKFITFALLALADIALLASPSQFLVIQFGQAIQNNDFRISYLTYVFEDAAARNLRQRNDEAINAQLTQVYPVAFNILRELELSHKWLLLFDAMVNASGNYNVFLPFLPQLSAAISLQDPLLFPIFINIIREVFSVAVNEQSPPMQINLLPLILQASQTLRSMSDSEAPELLFSLWTSFVSVQEIEYLKQEQLSQILDALFTELFTVLEILLNPSLEIAEKDQFERDLIQNLCYLYDGLDNLKYLIPFFRFLMNYINASHNCDYSTCVKVLFGDISPEFLPRQEAILKILATERSLFVFYALCWILPSPKSITDYMTNPATAPQSFIKLIEIRRAHAFHSLDNPEPSALILMQSMIIFDSEFVNENFDKIISWLNNMLPIDTYQASLCLASMSINYNEYIGSTICPCIPTYLEIIDQIPANSYVLIFATVLYSISRQEPSEDINLVYSTLGKSYLSRLTSILQSSEPFESISLLNSFSKLITKLNANDVNRSFINQLQSEVVTSLGPLWGCADPSIQSKLVEYLENLLSHGWIQDTTMIASWLSTVPPEAILSEHVQLIPYLSSHLPLQNFLTLFSQINPTENADLVLTILITMKQMCSISLEHLWEQFPPPFFEGIVSAQYYPYDRSKIIPRYHDFLSSLSQTQMPDELVPWAINLLVHQVIFETPTNRENAYKVLRCIYACKFSQVPGMFQQVVASALPNMSQPAMNFILAIQNNVETPPIEFIQFYNAKFVSS